MSITTIPASTRRRDYVMTGGETVLPVPFPFYEASDIQVQRERASLLVTLNNPADYTLSGVGTQEGGAATLTAPAQAGDLLVVRSIQPLARSTQFDDGGALPARSLNDELNRIVISQQQLEAGQASALRLPFNEGTASPLPPPAQRANRLLAFDAQGRPTVQPIPGAGSSLTGDASLAQVVATGTPTPQLLADRFGAMPSIRDFPSAKAALEHGGVLYVPPGVHVITGPVVLINKALTLIGAGVGVSILLWQGLGTDQTALHINNNNFTQPVHIEGLSLMTSQTDQGNALHIQFSENDATFARVQHRCALRDVEVRGNLADALGIAWQQNGWRRGILLTNVHRPLLENIFIAGRQTSWSESGNNTMLYGIRLVESGATSAPTDSILSNVQIYSCADAVLASGHHEGIRLEGCTFVQCTRGVVAITEGGIQYPYFVVAGCHMNCFRDIITLTDFFDVMILNNLFYKWDFVSVTGKVSSIAIVLSGAPRTRIVGNTVNNLTKDFSPLSPTAFQL
ncbi:glycosyl hydrolase family 28-related protein, partial [Roseococcus thiosulfatophilus]